MAVSLAFGPSAQAADVAPTVSALRIAGAVTGGALPVSSPEFQQMLASTTAGDHYGAAITAMSSKYFGTYLARRLAFQMMNPAYDASITKDNDASVFLIANMIGSGGLSPNISKWWSNNYTCLLNITATDGTVSQKHILDLTAAQLAAIDYRNDVVCTAGQQAIDGNSGANPKPLITIPPQHVGGYTTLSDRNNDLSFAMWGGSAGTNLRLIEGIWQVSTGFAPIDMASTEASATMVPRFIPENNVNFFHGQGQPACISCHGGGIASLNHGYSTVADIFDYNTNNGFTFFTAPTTNQRKSLGSTAGNRGKVLTCNLSQFAVCNPDSIGADPNQTWDVAATWGSNGLLSKMGWKGPTTGRGLNSLGTVLGQASIVYQNLTYRVIREVCPLGSFTPDQINAIASKGQSADDIRVIIASVASEATCH